MASRRDRRCSSATHKCRHSLGQPGPACTRCPWHKAWSHRRDTPRSKVRCSPNRGHTRVLRSDSRHRSGKARTSQNGRRKTACCRRNRHRLHTPSSRYISPRANTWVCRPSSRCPSHTSGRKSSRRQASRTTRPATETRCHSRSWRRTSGRRSRQADASVPAFLCLWGAERVEELRNQRVERRGACSAADILPENAVCR